jgi:hypothetical protein
MPMSYIQMRKNEQVITVDANGEDAQFLRAAGYEVIGFCPHYAQSASDVAAAARLALPASVMQVSDAGLEVVSDRIYQMSRMPYQE